MCSRSCRWRELRMTEGKDVRLRTRSGSLMRAWRFGDHWHAEVVSHISVTKLEKGSHVLSQQIASSISICSSSAMMPFHAMRLVLRTFKQTHISTLKAKRLYRLPTYYQLYTHALHPTSDIGPDPLTSIGNSHKQYHSSQPLPSPPHNYYYQYAST